MISDFLLLFEYNMHKLHEKNVNKTLEWKIKANG